MAKHPRHKLTPQKAFFMAVKVAFVALAGIALILSMMPVGLLMR